MVSVARSQESMPRAILMPAVRAPALDPNAPQNTSVLVVGCNRRLLCVRDSQLTLSLPKRLPDSTRLARSDTTGTLARCELISLINYRYCIAIERHMSEVDPIGDVEQLAGEVARLAHARRREAVFPWIGLHQRHQLLHRGRGDRRMHDQDVA